MTDQRARYMNVVVEPPRTNARAVERTSVRYVMLGWKFLQPNRTNGERYLAIALRIDNDTDTPQRIDLRYFRLRASIDGRGPLVVETPEALRDRRTSHVIEPGAVACVTLGFSILEPNALGSTRRSQAYRFESESGAEPGRFRRIGAGDRRPHVTRHLSSVSRPAGC